MAAECGITTIVEPQNSVDDLPLFARARETATFARGCRGAVPSGGHHGRRAGRVRGGAPHLRRRPFPRRPGEALHRRRDRVAHGGAARALRRRPRQRRRHVLRARGLRRGDRGARAARVPDVHARDRRPGDPHGARRDRARPACARPARRAASARARGARAPRRPRAVRGARRRGVHAAATRRAPTSWAYGARPSAPTRASLPLPVAEPRRTRCGAGALERLERGADGPADRHLLGPHARGPPRRGRLDDRTDARPRGRDPRLHDGLGVREPRRRATGAR